MAKATKIMLIRHAEKPDGSAQGIDADGVAGKESLIVQGWQRAGALVRFFAPADAQFQHPGIARPTSLFASGAVSRKEKEGVGSKSLRPEQTLTPLSQFLGSEVPFRLDFAEGQEAELAAAAVASEGVVLIAWQHEAIPAIANAIFGKAGAVPSKWPGDRFDVVWVFDLQPNGGYSFSQAPQMLLAGDLAFVIT